MVYVDIYDQPFNDRWILVIDIYILGQVKMILSGSDRSDIEPAQPEAALNWCKNSGQSGSPGAFPPAVLKVPCLTTEVHFGIFTIEMKS